MGTARDDISASATDADELIRLIMSGEKPPPGLHVETAPIKDAAGRPIGLSPVDADPFWAAPPAASNTSQPRVEALFSRGEHYGTLDVVASTPDIASIPEAVSVAEPESAPVVEPEARVEELAPVDEARVEEANVEEPQVEEVVAQVDDIETVVTETSDTEATFRVSQPKATGAAWLRPLPTPQSRALGADFVRELDWDEEVIADAEDPDKGWHKA